jgi:hypothetical protein
MKVGHINAGAIMVADDLALAASSDHLMQISLTVAEADAAQERYKYNTDKTKTVPINSGTATALILNGKPLGLSAAEAHVGIYRNSANNNSSTIDDRIKKARRASYSLMGAGLCGLNSAGPEVATLQYTTYVLPTLLYGLEAIILGKRELVTLEAYHRKNLRYIQHLPQSTATPAIHLLSGVLPAQALIDIRSLGLARNVLAAESGSPPAVYIRELITRQLTMKDSTSTSWASHVRKLLRKYNLPTVLDLISTPPERKAWKATVKRAVREIWANELRDQAAEKSTLDILNCANCCMGTPHPIWLDLDNPLDIRKATVQAQLLVQRYPLASSRTAGKNRCDTCPLCKTEAESTTHFLLHCSKLSEARRPYLTRILHMCRMSRLSVDPETLTSIILDPSYVPSRDKQYMQICRNLVYKLHHKRAIFLGGGSGYKRLACTL